MFYFYLLCVCLSGYALRIIGDNFEKKNSVNKQYTFNDTYHQIRTSQSYQNGQIVYIFPALFVDCGVYFNIMFVFTWYEIVTFALNISFILFIFRQKNWWKFKQN